MADEPRNYSLNRLTRKHQEPFTLANAKQTTGVSTETVPPLGGAYLVLGLAHKRATTSAVLESTKPSYRIQGSIDGTNYFTIGAATRTVTSTAWAGVTVSSTVPITHVRLSVNNFSTSAGAATTAENRVPLTVKLIPHN